MDKRLFNVIAIALIIILSFAVYSNSLGSGFKYDDEILIENNIYLQNWSYLPRLVTGDLGAGAGRKFSYYRPLLMLTFLMDRSFWRLNSTGYHITNAIFHILAAASLYWLITLLYGDRLVSLFAAIFFAVHPVLTEVVAWLSCRSDSMATLFALLCVACYIKQAASKHIYFSILTLLCFTLAILSKENALILPILLLLYHYAFKRKIKVRLFLSMWGIIFSYFLLRSAVLKLSLPRVPTFAEAFQRIPGFFAAIANYIKLLMLPFYLRIDYGNEIFQLSNPQVLIGIALVFLIFIYAFRNRKNNNLIFFAIGWFFITLLPVSNILPISFYMAERWLYLPSIGFFIILATGLTSLYRSKDFRIFTIMLIIGLLFSYSYLTIRRNEYWKEKPIVFFEKALEYLPNGPRLLNGLGNAYTDEGKYEKAVRVFNEAIESNPGHPDTYNNLSYVYIKMGKIGEAVDLLERAIRLKPDYADAYSNLGSVYGMGEQNGKAMAMYKKAIEINPDHVMAHSGLAAVYYFEGQHDLAVKHRDRVLELGYEKLPPELIELQIRSSK